MRTFRRAILALFLSACSLGSADEAEILDPGGKADGTVPVLLGSFVSVISPPAGVPRLVVFLSDYSYFVEETAGAGERGTFSFSHNQTYRFVRLVDGRGTLSRYAYELEGDSLRLKPAGGGWVQYQRQAAGWCADNADCAHQDTTGSDGWSCVANACRSAIADAVTTSFRLYETSLQEFTPYVLRIHTAGPYARGAQVVGLELEATEEPPTPPVTLFSFTGTRFATYVSYSWTADGELSIEGRQEFKASVTEEYPNPWGDTSINPDDEYSLEPVVLHEGMRQLLDAGEMDDPRWEDQLAIPNQTVEEMCLWGTPVRW